jgi:hypothetical protein
MSSTVKDKFLPHSFPFEKSKYLSLKSIIIFTLFILACAPNKPTINPDLLGSWLLVGFTQTEQGYTMVERGYSTQQSYTAYKIAENNFTEYNRGADYGIALPGGTIEYYDSIQRNVYNTQTDGSTISISGGNTLTYSLRTACGGSFLKLSSTTTGYDMNYGAVTVTTVNYCVKVLIDSLPSKWPGDSDITVPDAGCIPSQLFSW